MPTKDEIDKVATAVIELARTLHRELGCGIFESAYSRILAAELERAGFKVERERPVPCTYLGECYGEAFRLDLIVDDCLIVEVKSKEKLDDVFFKQVLTYLRFTGCRLGLLINFGTPSLYVKRIANNL